ncbi:MAG: NHLP bacteriocin export ABC transporter permease/ATPase subunit, partial [Thermoanaerobaculia bacterium]|nr:NHLP bacteriocin export ABC transporter permease/ATPase subunit [Thermoanaerobaculia bacterium]
VLGGTGVWTRPSAVGVDAGPLLRAIALVGESLDIAVRAHPDSRDDLSFEDTVASIAAASRFRTRRVALVGDWWTGDQGPYLGQRTEGKTPVALLPTSPRSYILVDPVSGERTPIDDEVAKGLEPFAWTFYRPFPPGQLKAMDLVKFGLHGLKPEIKTVALMGAAVGLLGTLTPTISGKVFDIAIPQAERGLLLQFTLGLAVSAFCSAAFKITQNIALLRVQGKMDWSVQAAVWDRLIDLPMSFFRNFNSGDLADRAAGVDQMRQIISGAGVAAVLGSISSLFNAVQMATYSFQLALTALGLTLLYVGVSWLVNWLQLRHQRVEFSLRGKISGLVLQLIGGVPKLRVSGAEGHAFKMWAMRFAEQRRVAFKIGNIQNAHQVFTAGYPVLSNLVIFYVMYTLKQGALERGEQFEMTTGDFLAFSAAFGIFTSAMQGLGDASLSMLRVVPVFERLKPILTTEPEVDPSKAYPGRLKGDIELSHVWFRYSEDSPWIVKDLSLKIKAGQMVAFVGGSGCGKSTLLKIMLGFEKPQKGSVYFDGQDLATLDLRMVRQQLGVVLQDSRLLPADIYRNIVGTTSRTLEDAWTAAQKASIADDIRAMPMGMHTVVSEGGGAFSGGQKPRLMIARALVNNPRIIFLDEATSALDNRAQAIVTESMNRLQATRIVIAHRLSTIVDSDIICYLDAGQIVEQGGYEALMAQDGKFAALAKRRLA